MKFSVLLPTRNRLDLLRYAIESVRRQDHSEWEIVVSDNHSAEDVGRYVGSLQDPRVRYYRTSRPLPVTENWNAALSRAEGDYVVMLGDDDALLPGYFSKLEALLRRHSMPELVYIQAVQYAYPGVIPGHPGAFLQTGYCAFMRPGPPFMMPAGEARRAVEQSMRLRLSYSFNMQHSLVSRAAIERLSRAGSFFQSPYPDYYATNALFLTTPTMLVVPEPLVAIGISPKSFGYYYFNARQEEGSAFLDNLGDASVPEFARDEIVPGNELLTCWYVAMACIERNFGAAYGVRVDRDRYRMLQVLYVDRRAGMQGLRRLWSSLTMGERLRYGYKRALVHLLGHLPGGSSTARRLMDREGAFPHFDARQRSVEYRSILELFEHWGAERASFQPAGP